MEQILPLVIVALAFSVAAACVSIVCLVRIGRLSAAAGRPPRGRGRGGQRLPGRGKLLQWPHQRPHR